MWLVRELGPLFWVVVAGLAGAWYATGADAIVWFLVVGLPTALIVLEIWDRTERKERKHEHEN